MTGNRDDHCDREEKVDPFREGRQPFWITVGILSGLVLIAWWNGWITPFWER